MPPAVAFAYMTSLQSRKQRLRSEGIVGAWQLCLLAYDMSSRVEYTPSVFVAVINACRVIYA